jgi:hypothetical protein
VEIEERTTLISEWKLLHWEHHHKEAQAEEDKENLALTLKHNQDAGKIFLSNSQVKLSREKLEIQDFDRNKFKILIMSQSQTETDLQHQQLQPCKNYLRKFPGFKTSVTEHRWVHKQKETRTLLLNRNSELFVV